MKTVTKLTKILRTVGVILLCFAFVFSCYATIMAATPWKSVTDKLAEVNGSANLIKRITFTTDYFSAMNKAAADKEGGSAVRAQKVEPIFAKYGKIYADAKVHAKEKAADSAIEALTTDFDYAAYIEKSLAMEDNLEVKQIEEAYDFFDSLTTVKLPKGKANININAGQAEAFLPGFYDELVSENGAESVGSYYEFITASRDMLTAVNEESPIENAVKYFENDFDLDNYLTYLEDTKNAEEDLEKEGFGDEFTALAEVFVEDGVDADELKRFVSDQYAKFSDEYPEVEYSEFAAAFASLVTSPRRTDGSYASVMTEIEKVRANDTDGFAPFLTDFTRNLVVESDKHSGIVVMQALWKGSEIRLWVWLCGIILVAASVIIKKAYAAVFMKNAKFDEHKDDDDVLLRVNHLKQYFKSGDYVTKAVDDVSFFIRKGEVFGLVGEPGCGKTTTGRTIINLYDPTDGDVYFNGLRVSSNMNGLKVLKYQLRKELKEELKSLKKSDPDNYSAKARQLRREYADKLIEVEKKAYESEEEKRRTMKAYREIRKARLTEEYNKDIMTLSGREAEERKQRYETEMKVAATDNIMTRMQMIFQDPIASINPRMTVREIIAEGLKIRGIKDKKYIDDKVYEMLELVGLVPEHADRYPHEFSGGQRQRIGIARAIVLEPELIIADEPISALDVSIQAQVINLMNELRDKMGLTILFIAHNLSVVKYFSDRIAVMYYGHIVEMATSDELFRHPLHPYTKSLLSAIPYPDPHYEKNRKRIEYNPALAHDYSVDKPSFREILPGHFIQCNDKEYEMYLEEIKE